MEKVHPAFGNSVESGGILGSLLSDATTIGNGLAAGIEDLSVALHEAREIGYAPVPTAEDKLDHKPELTRTLTPTFGR